MGSSDPPEVHQMPASMPAGALGDGFSPPQVSPAAADLSCPAVAADLPASPTDIPPVVTAPNSSFLGPGIGDPDAAGYEGSDDMETMSMGHCTNCTATLWSSVCSDCGHAADEDAHIFNADLVAEDYDVRPMAFPPLPTVLAYDERMLLHEEGPASTHPERPDRVRAVMARLQAAQLAGLCQTIPCREATRPEIEACHVPELAREVDIKSEEARIRGSSVPLKPDTYVNQHTSLCARLSAGACIDVAEAVVHGEARSGAAICRPPGHHAESNTSMGFCFFNNAAIAARAAQRAGASRVLIFDWDVHHGNGTQEIFEDDDSVLYISVHRHDNGRFYPFTGSMSSVGAYGAEGFSVNVGWPCAGMRNGDYLAAMHHVVLPIAYDFAPDLVIISAGFDAAEGDPIGGCHLTPDIYAHMTSMLQAVAPTVALLEGGYNLIATAAATEATLRVLLGERPPSLPAGHGATPAGMSAVAQAVRIQSRYWPCLQSLVGAFSRFLEPTPAVRHAPAMGLGVQLPRPFSATGVHSTPFVEEDDSALDEVYEYEGDSDKGGDEGEEEDYGGDEEAAWGNPAACDVPDNLCSGPLFAEALPSLPSLALGQEDDVGRLGPKPWAVTPAAGAAEADDPEEHGVENNPSAAATAVDPKPAAQLDKTSSPAAALLRPSPGDAGVRVSPVPDVIRAATPEDGPSDDSEGIKTGGPPRAHAARLWQRAALKAMVMKRSGKHGIRLHGLPSNVQTYCPGKPDA